MSRRTERLLYHLDGFLGLLFVKGLMMMTLVVLSLLVAVSAERSVVNTAQIEVLDFGQF